MSITPTHTSFQKSKQSLVHNKENLPFKAIYSTKDFAVAEKIIKRAERAKENQKKKCPTVSHTITLSELLEAYKKYMLKKGIDTLNETHYYSLLIKLSLNQHGKNWRQCLELEKKFYKQILTRRFFCRWIEKFIQTCRNTEARSYQITTSQSPMMINENNLSQMIQRQNLTPISQVSPIQSSQVLNNLLKAKDSDFIKQILSLSGQNLQNSSSFLNPLNTLLQNNQTTATVQQSRQDLNQDNSKISELPSNPVSLERSTRTRRKERAILTFTKMINKSLRTYCFSHSNEKSHRSKAFSKWREFTIEMTQKIREKNEFINHWIKAYEHHELVKKKQVFFALKTMGSKLKLLEDNELQVRVWVEQKLLNCAFFQWIDSFNQRSQQRIKLFKATNFWSKNCQQKHFKNWKISIERKKSDRLKYRNFFMVKCIFEFLRRSLPKALLQKQINYKDEFLNLIEIRRLKYFNQTEVDDTIDLYQMQIKAAIFHKIKAFYNKSIQLKANKAIMLTTIALNNWRKYTFYKQEQRQKQEQFFQNLIVARYQRLIQIWFRYSHHQQDLRRRSFCLHLKRNRDLKDRSLIALCNYTQLQIQKHKFTSLATNYHRQNLITKTIVSLEHNKRLSQASRIYFTAKYEHMMNYKFEKSFQALKFITKKRKIAKEISNQYLKERISKEKHQIFNHWLSNAFQLNRAITFWKRNTWRKFMALIKEGLSNSKHLTVCSKKAKRFRQLQMKKRFMFYLRESICSIIQRRQLLNSLFEDSQNLRLKRLFDGFINYYCSRETARIKIERMHQRTKVLKKLLVIKILKRNDKIQKSVRQMIDYQNRKCKKENLEQLRYSVQKQSQLRNSYYDLLVSRSRTQATDMLRHWHCMTIQRGMRRQSLQEREVYFQKLRFFRSQTKRINLKKYYQQRLMIFNLYLKKETQYNVIHRWRDMIHSQEHINYKRSLAHKRLTLIQKTLTALKRNQYHQKMSRIFNQGLNQKKQLIFYRIWHTAFLKNQVNEEAIQYLKKQKAKNILKGWKRVLSSIQNERLKRNMALFQYENCLKARLIQVLQNNIEQERKDREDYQMMDVKAYWFKLMKKFRAWRQITDRQSYLRERFTEIKQRSNYNQKLRSYKMMRKVFKQNRILGQFTGLKEFDVKARIFKIFKSMNYQAREERYQQALAQQHYQSYLKTKTFIKLRINRKNLQEKSQKVNKSQQFYQKLILMKRCFRMLQKNRQARKLLKQKFNNATEKLKILKKKSILRALFKESYYQRLELGALIYHKRKQYLRFQENLKLIKSLKNHRQLQTERVLALLALKIQKKAYFALKINQQQSSYKNRLKEMGQVYMSRKWFEVWRNNFINKNQLNYLAIETQSNVSFKGSNRKPSIMHQFSEMKVTEKTPIILRKQNYSMGGFLKTKDKFKIQ